MADEEKTAIKLETWLLIGFITAILLSTSLIVVTSFGKQTVFSAYIEDADQNIQYQQISKMRGDLGEDEDGGADAGVGVEYPTGQTDDAFQLVVVEQFLAQLLVGLG